MPTQTNPTVDITAASYKTLTIYLVDVTGDTATVNMRVDGAATDVQINAFVNAYQAFTNASVHRVDVNYVFRGVLAPSNADTAQRAAVQQGFNFLYRDANFVSNSIRLHAPLDVLFQNNSDTPDLANTGFQTFSGAYIPVAGNSPDLESISFTKRGETNPRIRF